MLSTARAGAVRSAARHVQQSGGHRTRDSALRGGFVASHNVATSSRVTLNDYRLSGLGRVEWRSSQRPRLFIPAASSSPSRLARAGMATEAAASPTPEAQITKRPAEPDDPDVYQGGEPSLIVTDRAIKHLSKVATKEDNYKLGLRVAVEPGGCHGYQYKMELTDELEDDDFRFSIGDRVHLIVDSTSLRLIKGSTIDYVTELIGSQFAIFHNPQAKGAGCGCGVSWEPAV